MSVIPVPPSVKQMLRAIPVLGPVFGPVFGLMLALVLASVSVTAAHAQATQINPGSIQNDINRQQQRFEQQQQTPRQQGPAVIGPVGPKSGTAKPGGPTFVLRKVVFDQSKFLTPEELDAIAARYVGRRVDIAALQQLVADVNALYARKGIVTGIATLPPQDASRGVVHIKLTEGRLGKTEIKGRMRISSKYILERVGQPAGDVLDVPKLNRDVVWFNRTNDVQLRALLQPGTNFGLTDLQLAVTEPPMNTLQIFADNQGNETTGRNELGVYYKLYGLLGIDDRFTFYGVKSDGNLNGNVAYNVPVNPWGGRLGVSYTQGKINIIEGPFRTLDVTGTSNQGAVNFTQPFIATQTWLVAFNAAETAGTTKSDFSAVATTDDRYTKSTAGFSVTNYGSFYSLTVSPAVNAIDWHDQLSGSGRSFNTFTGATLDYVKLPAFFSVSVLGGWQYSEERLLPGDQLFTIGGPTTVRGYPTNAVGGDSGYYANFELHRDWSQFVKGLDTFVFTDTGAVYSTAPSHVELTSSGVGASWTPLPSLTLEASLAFPWHMTVPGMDHQTFYARIIFRPLQLL
jgi:hemolysin activation/secretion protein